MRTLVEVSARGFGHADSTDAQIHAALRSAWSVDTRLLHDGTFFVGSCRDDTPLDPAREHIVVSHPPGLSAPASDLRSPSWGRYVDGCRVLALGGDQQAVVRSGPMAPDEPWDEPSTRSVTPIRRKARQSASKARAPFVGGLSSRAYAPAASPPDRRGPPHG